jgi:NAD-dependent dihydropyrimidine dehydrogenase PreA subunit
MPIENSRVKVDELKLTIYEIPFRTGKVLIDHEKCVNCKSYACVKACSLFGRAILRIQNGLPVLTTTTDDAKRLCIECLSCELYCQKYGDAGLRIILDDFGLDEYRHKIEQIKKEV